MIEIRTIDDVLSFLGGRAAVAKRTGRTPNAVTNWKSRGGIPATLAPVLDPVLERKGAVAHPSVYQKDKLAPQRRGLVRQES
jgi:hypothetical protein